MSTESQLYHFSLYLADSFDGYLVRENDLLYEYVSPIVYQWMEKVPLENWQETIETKKIPKEVVTLKVCEKIRCYEEWIFTYPIDPSTLRHFNDIACFFEVFTTLQKETIVPRLEKTILLMEKRIPFIVLESLVTFVFHQHKKHPDRLRFLFSPLITTYLKRCCDED